MTEAKSAHPQLPPRPERITDESGFYTLYHAHMNALEAERESLKAELREMTKNRDQWERNSAAENKRAGDALVKVARLEAERDKYKNKADQLRIAFVLSDAILPAEFEPTLPPTKRLHVYVDKALEVIREYREGSKHQGCTDLSTWPFSGVDNRCPTCIKADALLAKEGQ